MPASTSWTPRACALWTCNGRICGIGDKPARCPLHEAAHVKPARPMKASKLKTWAHQAARRPGVRKVEAALARRVALVLRRGLAEGVPFNLDLAGAKAAWPGEAARLRGKRANIRSVLQAIVPSPG